MAMTRVSRVFHGVGTVLMWVVLSAVCLPAGAQSSWDAVVEQSTERFGKPGADAARFLDAHRPPRDDAIDPGLVVENIGLALHARASFAWAGEVSDELFLNDVLPYAVLDEKRERWRARLLELAGPIVEGSTSAGEAAQALNRELFKLVNVRYGTDRRAANQSPLETMELGIASCTGLSILLVDACRSVGIPARVAGIAAWTHQNGNHTWVEIHDGTAWRFMGAAEYDANGLDRGWFKDAASNAVAGHELHAIWASSFRRTGSHFPLVWNLTDRSVPSVDSSLLYQRRSRAVSEPVLALRLWASRGGSRLAAVVELSHEGGTHVSQTYADPDDLNHMAELPAVEERPLRVSVTVGNETRIAILDASHRPGTSVELYWDELGLSEAAAAAESAKVWAVHSDAIRAERAGELEAMVIRAAGHELRMLRKEFGSVPEAGRSLWISMHGGGGAPKEVNDQQWQNQIGLYEPAEGIYIAPRAPSDTWNLWHRSEIDALFGRLIESAIVVWGVDPNRVYLMGYSAGGDGVYQLAPRMADRFAAAAMMAGHPNDASPLGLRNLPFAIFMGGDDGAFNRNSVAQSWVEQLGSLRELDPQGYPHFSRIYPGVGHWMQRKDAEALPWMAGHTRNPWPAKVVWQQGNTVHTRFYWLSVPREQSERGRTVRATVEDQTIRLVAESGGVIDLLLHDRLIDLDKPIRVVGQVVSDQGGMEPDGTNQDDVLFEGLLPRTRQAIEFSLLQRPDPAMIATARLTVRLYPDAHGEP
jgi:transglutaminase-like putative cysteine protease